MWAASIPIIGDAIKGAFEFANKRWGYNKTEQEIDKMTQEVIGQGNVLDTAKKMYDVIMQYEGAAKDVPKLILYGRCTWRIALQWGLTIKVLMGLFLYGKSIEEMKATIGFVAGLAVLREIGKKFNTKLDK